MNVAFPSIFVRPVQQLPGARVTGVRHTVQPYQPEVTYSLKDEKNKRELKYNYVKDKKQKITIS